MFRVRHGINFQRPSLTVDQVIGYLKKTKSRALWHDRYKSVLKAHSQALGNFWLLKAL